MNSLFKLCGHGQRAVIALIIFSALGLVAAAQTVAPQSQGRHYGDPGFQGEPINLNVVNADIRDILNYITEQYGVNFVSDKSVKPSPITVNVSDVPWNVALDSILRSQELGVQVNGPTYGFEPHVPFGGQRDSGTGWREPGTEALDVYSDWKTVYVTHDPSAV